MGRVTFTFAVDPADLFAERGHQMHAWGIPRATIERVRKRVRDMWTTEPGGWVPEWEREAVDAESRERWFEAAMLHGAAKFPCISSSAQAEAYAKQLACYTRATHVDRRVLAIEYRGATTRVPVHVFGTDESRPLVCLTGGVDTLKMELHKLAHVLARVGRFRVAAIDMPGTGESEVQLAGDSHVIYEGVIAALRGNTKAGIWGVSFGGHWAAKLACRETVDAAVDMGGPIGMRIFEHGLPNGMLGIVGNALGRAVAPDSAAEFSFGTLLDARRSAPLLVFNGARDPYVPIEDARAFEGWPHTRVWIFEDGDHCAANHIKRIVPAALVWLQRQLHGESAIRHLAASAAEALLPHRA
jgi:esterase FrsA